jgi:hypothetical protein
VFIVNVFPGEYVVPEPFAAVFHPENVNPVLANEPVFPKMVTVDPDVYGEDPSVGPLPPVLVLPLYVMVYRIIGNQGVSFDQLYARLSLAKPDLFLPGIIMILVYTTRILCIYTNRALRKIRISLE